MEVIFGVCFCIVAVYVMAHLVELIAMLTLAAWYSMGEFIAAVHDVRSHGVDAFKNFFKNF